MGCDIHLHVEILYKGRWEHWAHPRIERWYELFETLAGVRGEEEKAISSPKGFPSDAALATRLDYERWGADAHTPSWLAHDEIIELEKWLKKKEETDTRKVEWPGYDLEEGVLSGTYLFGNSLTAKWRYDDNDYAPGVEDVRLVFWFDN